VALLGVFVIASSLQEVLASVHQGLKEMEWIAGFRLAIVAATAAGVVLALAADAPLPLVVAAYPVAGVLGFASGTPSPPAASSRGWSARPWAPCCGTLLLYGGMYVASVLTFRQGVVVLSFFRSGVAIADFAAGYRLLEVSSKIPLVLSMALVPEMFRSARENPARLDLLFRMQLRVLGLLVLPVAVAIALFAPEIIRHIYGPGYVGAVPVLRVFSCMLPLSFMDGALGDSLTARDLQGLRTPHLRDRARHRPAGQPGDGVGLGPVGSAAALLLSEISLFTLLTISLGRITSLKPLRRVGRGALAAVVAGAACWLLRGRVSVLALGPAFLALYVVLCFAFQAVHREELERLVRRLRTG
jgi:O-antigen/teichoic acid export membrane protein